MRQGNDTPAGAGAFLNIKGKKAMLDFDSASRRAFLKSAATTGLGMLAASSVVGCAADKGGAGAQDQKHARSGDDKGPRLVDGPKQRANYSDLRIAYIGTGGIGGYHLEETTKLGVSCLCYCDVDTTHFKEAAEKFPKARGYQDYREMFDKEHKNFDAVMIGIPDHNHYPATVIAMQHGKHTYTQKPLTHTPWEAMQLAEGARKYKLATQMGNQGHAGEGIRLVYEWVRSGMLGDIKEVHTWTDRPIWPQGIDRPKDKDDIPSSLNWDCWLGPAPVRPFKKDTYHPFKWRGWWDFGAGALGDMACHTMDCMFWAMDPGHPTAVEPFAATPITADAFPKSSIIRWEFPARGRRRAFEAYWYDGGLLPCTPAVLELGRKLPSTGNLFIGTKASILVSGDYANSARLIPETKMKELGAAPRLLAGSPGHVLEWVMACVGDAAPDYPKSNFGYAGPMSSTILLGNVALHAGRRLEWNGSRVTNMDEANQWVNKEYRDGWKVHI